jgi:hypothetical protein
MSDFEINADFNASMFDLTPPAADKGEQQPSAPSLGHECVLCHVGVFPGSLYRRPTRT